MSRDPVGIAEAARAAFDRGEFQQARDLFEAALAERRTPEALDGLGQALWFLCEIEAGIARREDAYADFRRAGELGRAAEIALWLAVEHATSLGNETAASGWFRRAERILAATPPCRAHAQLEVHRGLSCGDPDDALRHFERAVEIGRKLGDPDSEVLGLNQVGFMKVVLGELDAGLALLDESMAAAVGGELTDPWTIGATCCSVLFACDRIADLKRAAQWCRVVFDFTERRRFVPLSALCRSIYAGLLISSGDWARAEVELRKALDTYHGIGRPLAAYPLARLADLRIRQGRIEEAEQLTTGWEGHPDMTVVKIRLQLERGEYALAGARLEHLLTRLGSDSPLAVSFLPLLVRLRIAEGDEHRAVQAANDFSQLARRLGHEHLVAQSGLIAAQVGLLRDDESAVLRLESSVEAFSMLGMPFEEATAHVDLARAAAAREPTLAVFEARVGLELFERLGAAHEADRAAALLRSLGVAGRKAPKHPGGLTEREGEVLVLLEHGLSNKQIAARLYISPKTAAHHVSRILTKLNLSSRAEAAAVSARGRAQGHAGQ